MTNILMTIAGICLNSANFIVFQFLAFFTKMIQVSDIHVYQKKLEQNTKFMSDGKKVNDQNVISIWLVHIFARFLAVFGYCF